MDSWTRSANGTLQVDSVTPEASAMSKAYRPMAEALLLRVYALEIEASLLREENEQLRANLAAREPHR